MDLSVHIAEIARALAGEGKLGRENLALSKRNQLRFGAHGSVTVETGGGKRGSWYDHELGIGGGPWDLLREKASLVDGAALDWLRRLGIEIASNDDIVDAYDYFDEAGILLFQVCRTRAKSFPQRRPDGRGGWIWSTKGVRRVLYRLPDLLAAPIDEPLWVVEGEKDANTLVRLGFTATCNPGGAAKRRTDGRPGKPKWLRDFNQFFRDRDAIVVPDNDDAGRDHARAVASGIAPLAARVRLLELPGLAKKGDVSDWLAAGGTAAELERLAEAAPIFGSAVEVRPPEFSDDALALRFAEQHASELRFVAHWSRWFIWNDGQWKSDDTLRAFDLARAVCRNASAESWSASKIASAKTVAAVERLAKSDRRHAATVDQWDFDPWLLLTGNNVHSR